MSIWSVRRHPASVESRDTKDDVPISDAELRSVLTKKIDDAWLTGSALAGITQCKAPVMLLNDFVDPALAARAEALTQYRHANAP